MFKLKDLPEQFKGLEGVRWTALEVPGKPDHVILYQRSKSLDLVKKDLGIQGRINFTGGTFEDLQANVRLTAAFATLLRNPGDKILVNYSPGNAFPGGGDVNNPDNWWYWPEQLGNPTAEYSIAQTQEDGQILHMYREFERGILHIYPKDGYARIELPGGGALV
jgi:hypothetical protein